VLVLPFVLVAAVIGIIVALVAISFSFVVPIAVAALCIWIGLRLASPAAA